MKQKLFTKNFTLLVLGQTSSLFGNYILRLALSMYVLEATGSAAVFAGLLSLSTIPMILLSPFGGILADRADRRKIMVALDTLSGLAVLCSAVVLSGKNAFAVIGILLVALSVLGTFETPTVQACIPGMLEGDQIIRGNAVVNQTASVSYLTAPMLGSILYSAFGLKPVMYASAACFLLTALLECFIRTGYRPADYPGTLLSMIREDFVSSFRFLRREEAGILNVLVLAAISRFFVMGVTLVGLPYIVRTVLGLNAGYYGAAESMLAVATILGSIAAGLLVGKLRPGRLSVVLGAVGFWMIPAGAVFCLPCGAAVRYAVNVACFCGMQAAISIFSIFAVSMIQQNTPEELLGKVMAYTSAITMCVQPAGQMVYGFLFDRFSGAVYLVLIPAGIAVCLTGVLSAGFFKKIEEKQ